MNGPDILKINEDTAAKFLQIEANLAAHRTAVELFEALLAEIETAFGIPFVWISILRLPETAGLLRKLGDSAFLDSRVNIIEKERFLEIVPDVASPLLACGHLRPFFRLLPQKRQYLIRSIAVSAIIVRGRPIGSINCGDASPSRYDPGMDTTLMKRLARSVSDRLSVCLPELSK